MNRTGDPMVVRRGLAVAVFLVPAVLLVGLVGARRLQMGAGPGPVGLAIIGAAIVYLMVGVCVAHSPALLSKLGLSGSVLILTLMLAVVTVPALRSRVFSPQAEQNTEFVASKRWPPDESKSDWWPGYCAEFDGATPTRWFPYVYWRRAPFEGEFINVNEAGKRRTWHPGIATNGPRIWFFGGSTVWGEGARDDFTIPSLACKALDDAGMSADCANFGEKGFVTTQSVLALYLELRRGNVPDAAVFYEGFNDVWSAFQNEYAGLPLQERKRRLQKSTGSGLWPNLEGDALIQDMLDIYFANLRVLEMLAEEYGFEVLSYLQPVPFVDKVLTDKELQIIEEYRATFSIDADLDDFIRSSYDRILQIEAPQSLRDLSSIFADNDTDLYIDLCHVTEQGNLIVADRIATDVLTRLEARID